MSRLSLRIFLSFFAALLAISLGAVLITWWVLAERVDDAGPGLGRIAAEAARALAAGGRSGLEDWARELESRDPAGRPVLIIDETGREILGRPLPPRLWRVLRAGERDRRIAGAEPVTLRLPERLPSLIAGDGTRFRIVVPARAARARGMLGLPDTRLPLLLLAIGVAAAFSGLLARSITRPVRDLERAAESLAAGQLDTRVAAGARRRGDEIGRLAAAFDTMAARLAGLLRGREQLLRDVSHELRSPLARMRLAAGLARQGGDVPRQLQRIEREISRLDELIGALLDVSRLEAGAAAMSPERVDVAALVDQVVEDARFEAEATGRGIDWHGAAAPTELQGDPRWLGSAIENVVRNALRHAPAGSRVRIGLDELPGALRVTVADEGTGVPEAELQRIFEPFHRVEQDRDRATGGAGLGLAIAARVLAAHGGRIEARNRHDAGGAPAGLEVSLWLPRPSAGRPAAAPRAPA